MVMNIIVPLSLQGSDAQIHVEDQSYEHTMHVQSSNPIWDAACSYTYLCTCEGFIHVGRTIYMGNSACTERNCTVYECVGVVISRIFHTMGYRFIYATIQVCAQVHEAV